MISSSILKQRAKESLKGNIGASIGLLIVFAFIVGILAYIPIFGFLATYALTWGFSIAFLKAARGEPIQASHLFCVFKSPSAIWLNVIITMFCVELFTSLWTMLLIIPGIIKGLSYAMTPFILHDHPDCKDAIDRSIKMMEGHKKDLFVLFLSFTGWWLLCIITLGLAMLWAVPYYNAAVAQFYEELRRESGDLLESELPDEAVLQNDCVIEDDDDLADDDSILADDDGCEAGNDAALDDEINSIISDGSAESQNLSQNSHNDARRSNESNDIDDDELNRILYGDSNHHSS